MSVLIRFILFVSILICGYFILKYIFNPKRKFELAHQNGELSLFDDHRNVQKNLLVTQKGVLFEGEKYMGTADQAFRVIHIKLWPKKTTDLHGLSKQDFTEIEGKIFEAYPYAVVEWKSPVRELLNK